MAFPEGKFFQNFDYGSEFEPDIRSVDLESLCENDACGGLITYEGYKYNKDSLSIPSSAGLSTDITTDYYVSGDSKLRFPAIGTCTLPSSSGVSLHFRGKGANPQASESYVQATSIKVVRTNSGFTVTYITDGGEKSISINPNRFYKSILPTNIFISIQAAGASGGAFVEKGNVGGGSGAVYYVALNMTLLNNVTVMLGEAGDAQTYPYQSRKASSSYIYLNYADFSNHGPYIVIGGGGTDGDVQPGGILGEWSGSSSAIIWKPSNPAFLKGNRGGNAGVTGSPTNSKVFYTYPLGREYDYKWYLGGAGNSGGGGGGSTWGNLSNKSGGDGGAPNTVGEDAYTFGAGGGGGGNGGSALGGKGGAACASIYLGYKKKN